MFAVFNSQTGEAHGVAGTIEAARARCLDLAGLAVWPEDGYCGFDYVAIDSDTAYVTAGRDYNSATCYECLIGAYPVTPNRSLSGDPLPETLYRATGFKSAAAARRAAVKWWSENAAQLA